MRDIFTGLVYINHGTTGAEIQFPFGGVRGTGNGHREAGQAGLELFTEWNPFTWIIPENATGTD